VGAWSLYFLAKLVLHGMGLAQVHWLANLLFAIALAWPVASRRARVARDVIALAPAAWLLALDLAPGGVVRLDSLADLVVQFRTQYVLELAGRLPLARIALGLGALLAIWLLLRRRVRFATFAIAGLLAVPLLPAPGAGSARAVAAGPAPARVAGSVAPAARDPDSTLSDFLERERGRRVFPARAGVASFDLLILSVCSLSIDDLDAVHLQDSPVLSGFDVVFRQFNSAATYSGPAVLRLLHATCGQPPQSALYSTAPARECLLLPALEDAGYSTQALLNHDGRYGNFARQVRDYGGLSSEVVADRAAAVELTAFDGTPVRSDLDVLSRWLRERAGHAGPVALLYNTITLHDGTSGAGLPADSVRSYAPRLTRLLSDLDRFLQLVRESGRPTVVVLVPEHGAALRADAQQVTGLRELPTRAITRVPVAVKLLGFAHLPARAAGAPPLYVDRPASYLAISTLVAGLMQLGTDGVDGGSLAQLVDALPGTAWVSENEGTILLGREGGDLLRTPQGRWSPISN
jgi:cellulose synthase operon protein YhjU